MDSADTGTLTVDRLALLEFLDVKSDYSRGHATGVVSVVGEDLNAACFQHYAKSKGATVTVLPNPVTTGKQSGPRLDRWIKVDWPDGSKILYQTEIKNWSAHAIGGKNLPVTANPQEIADYKQRRWARHWDAESRTLRSWLCAKVLTPGMIPPHGLDGRTIRPLLIFWEAIGPKCADVHLFDVAVSKSQSPKFRRLYVFSVSSYLRSLKEPQIALPLPNAARRIQALNDMFK